MTDDDKPKFDGGPIREMLRLLPVNERAETIVEIFRIISAEFAAMVLDHVEVEPNDDAKPH